MVRSGSLRCVFSSSAPRTHVMNRLSGTLVKCMVLIAIVLPIEQIRAASCCCRTPGAGRSGAIVPSRLACCTSASGADADVSALDCCCHDGRSGPGGTRPCRCPYGCCGWDASMVAVPDDVGPAFVAGSNADVPISPAPANNAAADLGSFRRQEVLRSIPSGAVRCVLLCRFTR